MPSGFSCCLILIGFPHDFWRPSTSGPGGDPRALEREISEADDANEVVVLDRERLLLGVCGASSIGMLSTSSWACWKASDKTDLRSSVRTEDHSIGAMDVRASCIAAMASDAWGNVSGERLQM
jgi:hypothetical protein